jgi:hypothetical protein
MTKQEQLEKAIDIFREVYPDLEPEELILQMAKYLKDNPESAEYVLMNLDLN